MRFADASENAAVLTKPAQGELQLHRLGTADSLSYVIGPALRMNDWFLGCQRRGNAHCKERRTLKCTAVDRRTTVVPLPTLKHGIARTTDAGEVPALLQNPDCLACIWIPASETDALNRKWLLSAERVQVPSGESVSIRYVQIEEQAQQRAALRDLLRAMNFSNVDMEPLYAPFLSMIQIFKRSLDMLPSRGWVLSPRYIDLRLSYLDRTRCPRFHTDSVPLRMLCTLQGPGTEIARETFVWRERFETARRVGGQFLIQPRWWRSKTLAACTAAEHAQHVVFRPGVIGVDTITTPQCTQTTTLDTWALTDSLPHAPIERLMSWHAAFLKGAEWDLTAPDSSSAVIHRSPTIDPGKKRWLFQIDVHLPEEHR
jgi:hypothetical protein